MSKKRNTRDKKNKNFSLWQFFTSVKLALTLISLIAITSIIGTVLPQNQPPELYAKEFGESMADLMQKLQLTDMYSAWWFLLLLLLFTINLIVCSMERIPRVFKILKRDNLQTSKDRLSKFHLNTTIETNMNQAAAVRETKDFLTSQGWKVNQREKDGGTLLFSQKGGWSRFGVYIVHLSILLVLAGAVIGSPMFAEKVLHNRNFAFKGSVMIPETRQADFIFSMKDGKKIDLGFSLYCNYFAIEYYPNGMVKSYLSKITVLEDGKPVKLDNGKFEWELKVNNPLTHRGVTFYQSSYTPDPDLLVVLIKKKNSDQFLMDIIPQAQEYKWEEGGVTFGILNVEGRGQELTRAKIWFSDKSGSPVTRWLDNDKESTIKTKDNSYQIRVKQLYATGIQATKDPGIWVVYIAFLIMLFGLMVAFFMSHRKIFVFVEKNKNKSRIIWAGSTNKNKLGFSKVFKELTDKFKTDIGK